MSTVRQVVADQIREDNPDFIVKGFPSSTLDKVPTGKTFVRVYRETLEPITNGTSLNHSLTLTVMVASKGTDQSETDLEEALDLVLLSLERSKAVIFQSATRGINDENQPLYIISAIASTTNHYKSLVREEQKAVTP
jgi:hypothetical protein